MTIPHTVVTKIVEIGLTLLIILVMLVTMALTGCKEVTDTTRDVKKTSRTIEITKTQTITPEGQIVVLTTRKTTLTDEITGEVINSTSEQSAPEVLGQLGGLVKAGVTAVAGPVAGNAAGGLLDYAWQALAGAGAVGVSTAAGVKAVRNGKRANEMAAAKEELERHRQQLIEGMEDAKEEMDPETWKKVKAALAAKQDRDLQDHIREATA